MSGFESVVIVKEIVVSELSRGAHVVDMSCEGVRTVGVRSCDWGVSVVGVGV